MPGRQSNVLQPHGGPSVKSAKSKAKKKDKKRSLHAYEIAAQENPERIKIRQSRLGVSDGGERPGKRARAEEDSEEDAATTTSKRSRRDPPTKKGRFDQLDVDEGSDSEGNEWKLGHVDKDDDSDLDSDEAFGQSDEERFEDYAFGGSSKRGKSSKKKKSTARKDIDLNEDGEDENSEADSDSSLGEDAIDLAQMLDDEDEDMVDAGNGGEDESSEDESEDESEESSVFSRDHSEEADPAKLSALRNLIDTLPQESKSKVSKRKDDVNELNRPSDFGLKSASKLTLDDLGLPSVQDPHIKKSLKYLDSPSKPGKKIKGKLEVPLERREQDRLDREAAYQKSKETLSKWVDTVAHNRRADHLIFPLPDADVASTLNNTILQPAATSKPATELEATIQSIMEESGLATTNGKDDEDKIREFEELEANKMSLEDVKARRQELRASRDLMFREEAKAKRIKKIKSKSYRRVHRKQREKDERISREALLEAGIEPSEDEQELQDRRRAAERMGSRHRNSKWAKATKDTGRAAWDDDARAGVTEMARRNEELRKRVEGKTSRRNEGESSDVSASESSEDDSDRDNDERLKDQLDRLDAMSSKAETTGSRLANLKFMKKAEAARKIENDRAIEELKRDLAGEESESVDEAEIQNVGRRTYGPGTQGNKSKAASKPEKKNEFEEPLASDGDEVTIITQALKTQSGDLKNKNSSSKSSAKSSRREAPNYAAAEADHDPEAGAWSKQPVIEGPGKSKKGVRETEMEELDLSQAVVMAKAPKVTKKKTTSKKPSTLGVDDDDDDSDSGSDNASAHPFAVRDQELIKRAFAGADVVGEFEREKQQTIQDEDEKIVDNTIPGWGSWTGAGIKKSKKKDPKFLTKVDGIKADKRKDAKLAKVIINEKRIKKNTKYLASSLPHPFETRQQYERSLRLPVGPEWSTKETFQDATKPRVIVKQGIIAPMSKPMF